MEHGVTWSMEHVVCSAMWQWKRGCPHCSDEEKTFLGSTALTRAQVLPRPHVPDPRHVLARCMLIHVLCISAEAKQSHHHWVERAHTAQLQVCLLAMTLGCLDAV